MTTGAQVFPTLNEHNGWVNQVFFPSDSSRIISQTVFECLSWDATTGHRIHTTEQSDHRFSSPMYITYDGWIVDSVTDRTLSKLPAMVDDPNYATHGRSLAMTTSDGHLYIMHFPEALLTSPDTRPVEGKTRRRFVQLSADRVIISSIPW